VRDGVFFLIFINDVIKGIIIYVNLCSSHIRNLFIFEIVALMLGQHCDK
jgi:hypothetical protein